MAHLLSAHARGDCGSSASGSTWNTSRSVVCRRYVAQQTIQPGNIGLICLLTPISKPSTWRSSALASVSVGEAHLITRISIEPGGLDEVQGLPDELPDFVGELAALIEGFAELATPAPQEVVGLLDHMLTLFCCQVSYTMQDD